MTGSGTALPESPTNGVAEDWWGQFHLHSFMILICADEQIERRELVWVKRFFIHRNKDHLYEQMMEIIDQNRIDRETLDSLSRLAAERMTTAEKRRFVYNLAQMCKSKGGISSKEYEYILDLAERIGLHDTIADAIINSVFSINDTFMAIVGLLALGVILYFTKIVIVPLIIALFITMIITKVETLFATRLRLRRFRWLNKIAAMVLIISSLFAMVMATAVAGKDVLNRRAFYEQKIGVALQQLDVTAKQYGITFLDRSGAIEQLKKLPIGEVMGSFIGQLVNLMGNFLLVVIFTGFLVFSSTGFKGILQEMNEKISGYISVKSLSSLITGIVVFSICKAFGLDFALFWAVLGFLLNFIPSVGSIIASIPPILLSMIQLEAWSGVLLFSLSLVVAHVLIGQVLEPKLMGSRLAVKPVAILMGLIFWGFLWGLPGMFLAAPLMALLRILSSYFNFSRNFERLLAAD